MNRSSVFSLVVVLIVLIGIVILIPIMLGNRVVVGPRISEVGLSGISEKKIVEEMDGYKVNIGYPELSISDEKVMETVNDSIKVEAQDMFSSFIDDVSRDSIKIEGVKSELTSKYDILFKTRSFVSLRFTDFYYVSGMAHPQTVYRVFNYDIDKNKEIVISDIFSSGSDYLSPLSSIAKEDVKRQLEPQQVYFEDMASLGTEPRADNYSIFNFNKEGITIVFGQYAVAPYAVGPVFVDISYDKLIGINPELIARIKTAN
ncbi:MAG: RsiV family protein [Candidatus Colwellbacteria bacterium]|nr:RsiV family protein [Candidatus Colwellbacteria bacterium]